MNLMHGEERIVFEKAANLVRYHTWFVEPFVTPSENDSLLETLWQKASIDLNMPVTMGPKAITYVGDSLRL